jgi:lipopolysaccharide cholinephosphotransferase
LNFITQDKGEWKLFCTFESEKEPFDNTNQVMNNQTDSLAAKYEVLNRSFRVPLIYHLGIDAGFFTEYMYMLNAMLFALHRGLQFRLYSADANFGVQDGWTDFFLPFCPEDREALHHRYNRHALPSLEVLLRRNPNLRARQLLQWKAKARLQSEVGHWKAHRLYHQAVKMNQDVRFRFDEDYPVPALGWDADYLKSFHRLTDLTWHFNAETEEAARQLTATLGLPDDYLGCQLRGGDKATEVSPTSPDALAEALRQLPRHEHVFVLTDDYRLFEYLQTRHPDIHWYTLCTPAEQGYVNKSFTDTAPEQKRRQMQRFLTSMRILMHARHFVGSICPGPSLFLLKYLWPNATPLDCAREDFPHALTLPVRERGQMAKRYTPEELHKLHNVLYEVLGEVIRVCEKHHLPYFVIGGTAIGTLYDQGILPWDDDIDIGMRRADYERFLQIAPQELSADYFLSWYGTEPHTPYYFAKVKKHHTSFVEPMFREVPMHPGIFVDIFPFDRIPDSPRLQRLQHEAAKFLFCCLIGKETWLWRHFGRCRIANPSNRGPLACLLNRLIDLTVPKRCLFGLLKRVQTAFNGSDTLYYNNVMTRTDRVKADDLAHLEAHPFGPLTVTAPRNVEAFLRYNYPKLHRFTPEEVEAVAGHVPVALSFDTRVK